MIWPVSAIGTVNGLPCDDSRSEDFAVTAEELHDPIDMLLSDQTAQEAADELLAITLPGDGIGEEGTTVAANPRGKAELRGQRAFNICVNQKRTATLPDGD